MSLKGIRKYKRIPIISFEKVKRTNVMYGFSSSIQNLGPLLENKTTVNALLLKNLVQFEKT